MHRRWLTVSLALVAMLLVASGCDMKKKITAPSHVSGTLAINEFMASNQSFGADENGEFDDWIEIYNGSTHAIDLAGYHVTDNLGDHSKYIIPSGFSSKTTVQPGGFILIWCDGTPDQGPLHTPFKLSASGEDIGLYDPTGDVIEELTFGPQSGDISYGVLPDGGSTWQFFTTPTPGASNAGGGGGGNTHPAISGVALNPTTPTAGNPVTVSAQITDNGSITSASLYYAVAGGAFSAVVMTNVGATYSGTIPAQSSGATVAYYLRAVDNESNVTTLPATAPTTTLSYTVGGGTVPVLYVNEILASNAAGLPDPNGEYDDWFEIYNPGSTPVDLGGMFVTDDLAVKNKWQIPATDPTASTVPAHGYLLFWADSQPTQGVVHVNFKLSAAGEAIGLYTSSLETIDEVTFGAQTSDVSYARVPDGSTNWLPRTSPTPGATNGTVTIANR